MTNFDEDIADLVQQTSSLLKTPILKLKPDLQEAQKVSKNVLLGKLFLNRILPEDSVYNALSAAWKTIKEFNVRRVTDNVFIFQFQTKSDQRQVFTNSPWFISNKLLILKVWNATEPLDQITFQWTPLWIRVLGLPLIHMSDDNAGLIADLFAGILEIDRQHRVFKGYLRIKVRHDINLPLIAGFLNAEDENNPAWIRIAYEKVGDFCYTCGRVTHVSKDCLQKEPSMASIEGRLKPLFGPWLRIPTSQGYPSKFPHSEMGDSTGKAPDAPSLAVRTHYDTAHRLRSPHALVARRDSGSGKQPNVLGNMDSPNLLIETDSCILGSDTLTKGKHTAQDGYCYDAVPKELTLSSKAVLTCRYVPPPLRQNPLLHVARADRTAGSSHHGGSSKRLSDSFELMGCIPHPMAHSMKNSSYSMSWKA